MKLTPQKLVKASNALSDIITANDDPEFTVQARRWFMQVNDEIKFWNNLSKTEREAIKGQQIQLQATPIAKHPSVYPNSYIEALNPIFAKPLPEKTPRLKELLAEQKNGEPVEAEKT